MKEMNTSAETTGWLFTIVIMLVSSLAFFAIEASGSSLTNTLPSEQNVVSSSFSNMTGACGQAPTLNSIR